MRHHQQALASGVWHSVSKKNSNLMTETRHGSPALQHLLARALATIAVRLTAQGSLAADPYPKQANPLYCSLRTGRIAGPDHPTGRPKWRKLGQTIVVDNRPGGDSVVGIRAVKALPSDGYTVLATASTISMLPYTKADPGFEIKDFAGVGFMARSPIILSVGPGQPELSLNDLIARAKKEPLTYGSAGPASPPSLACAMFQKAAGIELTQVSYKGNGPAILDVIANRVNMICDGYISSASFLKSGQLRPLGVTTATRIQPLPDVRTFSEQGLNYTFEFWLGLMVNKSTPTEVVRKLSEALKYALDSKELGDRLRSEGSNPGFVTPDAFNDHVLKEHAVMGKLAADLKLVKD
jgi:tripartite-type tricarboxylate transporter receptor subunit TctC